MDLKPLVDAHVARVMEQRRSKILEQEVILTEAHHRYLGLEQLNEEWNTHVVPKRSILASVRERVKCVFVGETGVGKTCLIMTTS